MDVYEVSQETLKEIVNSGADVGVIGEWAIWAYNPYKYPRWLSLVGMPISLPYFAGSSNYHCGIHT